MKKLIYSLAAFFSLITIFSSCDDTKTYAELLEDEKAAIRKVVKDVVEKKEGGFLNISDDELDQYLDGGLKFDDDQWYKFENGLYMKINDFGDTTRMYKDLNNPNIIVRYDSCYNLLVFNDLSSPSTNNLENYAGWRLAPWRFTGVPDYSGPYGYGIDFAPNFIGEGGQVSLIIPSKLNVIDIQQAVVPFYYREVNYLPDYQ